MRALKGWFFFEKLLSYNFILLYDPSS